MTQSRLRKPIDYETDRVCQLGYFCLIKHLTKLTNFNKPIDL